MLTGLALMLAAAPPPPALLPKTLSGPVDGYDLSVPYQVWRGWVEEQKGAATELLLAEPEALPGEEAYGAPLLRFQKYNDHGHFLTGEIRAYCRVDEDNRYVPGSCHYRLRRAYVQHDAGGFDGNPVQRWTEAAFDAAKLAAHLRALGLPPGTDWWKVDPARLFSGLPSPVQMLAQNATVVRLDTRDCPALSRALTSLDGRRIDLPVDLQTVGRDRSFAWPAPHAIRTVYTLSTITPGAAEEVTIRGYDRSLDALVAPVLDTADECERKRGNPDAG